MANEIKATVVFMVPTQQGYIKAEFPNTYVNVQASVSRLLPALIKAFSDDLKKRFPKFDIENTDANLFFEVPTRSNLASIMVEESSRIIITFGNSDDLVRRE